MRETQTTECTRCHRPLRSAASISAGYGRTCLRKVRETASAAVDLVKPDTLAKALEDIEDGAIVDTRRVTRTGRRVYAVVSSDGTRTYLTNGATACTCAWGLKGKPTPCRHAVAAAILIVA